MIKDNIKTAFKLILADRLMITLLALFIVACISYCVYVGLSLRPSDLQVAVHYTAFGSTNFYRAKWWNLLAFIGFGLVMAAAHSSIAIKIYTHERRQLALLFISLSFLMLIIAWVLTWSVLRIAAF